VWGHGVVAKRKLISLGNLTRNAQNVARTYSGLLQDNNLLSISNIDSGNNNNNNNNNSNNNNNLSLYVG
jgi:hypothetical protein